MDADTWAIIGTLGALIVGAFVFVNQRINDVNRQLSDLRADVRAFIPRAAPEEPRP